MDEVLTSAHVHLDPPMVLPQAKAEVASPAPLLAMKLPDMLQGLDVENLNLEALQKAMIEEALRRTYGNQVQAAKYLGVSRDALCRRMVKCGLLD